MPTEPRMQRERTFTLEGGAVTWSNLRRMVLEVGEVPDDHVRIELREHKTHSPVDYDAERIRVTVKVED